MNLSEKIMMLKDERHLTYEEIGKIVGVGKSTVRKWAMGDIKNMRRDKIALLADALGVTPGYLMGWEEEDPADASPAPKTQEARIISEGVDRLPPKARKNALEFYNTLFKMLENEFREEDEDDT